MYYNSESLGSITEETFTLIKKYEGLGKELKSRVDTAAEYEIIWSDSLDEPNAPDLISGMEKGVFAKIYKREPKKKAYLRKNHYLDGKPVYSVIFGENEPFSEKFYVCDGGYIVGTEYHTLSAKLISLTLSAYDENGRPSEYRAVTVKKMNPGALPNRAPIIENTVYFYENGCISKAEYLYDFGDMGMG